MAISTVPHVAGNDITDHLSKSSAARVMANGDTIFTVVGDILIFGLLSECYTANGATASTLQYQLVSSTGTSTLSAASASLANAAAGVSVVAQLGALTNAPAVTGASGAGVFPWGAVRCPPGAIKLVVGVGTTTGTWTHYLRYEPLEAGAYVVAA